MVTHEIGAELDRTNQLLTAARRVSEQFRSDGYKWVSAIFKADHSVIYIVPWETEEQKDKTFSERGIVEDNVNVVSLPLQQDRVANF